MDKPYEEDHPDCRGSGSPVWTVEGPQWDWCCKWVTWKELLYIIFIFLMIDSIFVDSVAFHCLPLGCLCLFCFNVHGVHNYDIECWNNLIHRFVLLFFSSFFSFLLSLHRVCVRSWPTRKSRRIFQRNLLWEIRTSIVIVTPRVRWVWTLSNCHSVLFQLLTWFSGWLPFWKRSHLTLNCLVDTGTVPFVMSQIIDLQTCLLRSPFEKQS